MDKFSKSLDHLSSYIEEKKHQLNEILKEIGIEKEELSKKQQLVQCRYNRHHYVPQDSIVKHETTCPYMAVGMTKREIKSFIDENSSPSTCSGPLISITPPISLAIRQYVNIKKQEESGHMTQNIMPLSSLESNEVNNDILQSSDPILLIRYIKSWVVIPHPFCQLLPSSVHPVSLKSWLFRNIPEHHSFKHEVNGALHIVDVILHHFNATQTVNPDLLVNRLQPFLYSASRGLVLSMWKFLSILRIQQEHNINDNTVNELLPLPLLKDKIDDDTSLVSQIKSLADHQQSLPLDTNTQQLPLPMAYNRLNSTVEEKKILYDYCVELGKKELGSSVENYLNDQSLFRDDTGILSGKEKRDGEEKTHLEQLQEKRDIRRRRQSYRAKNVHITQKSIKQMFHEIIAARTEELQLVWESENADKMAASRGDKEEGESRESRRSKRSRSREERRKRSSSREERSRRKQRSSSREERSRRKQRSSSREERSKRKQRSSSREERSQRKRHKRSRSRDRSHDRYKDDREFSKKDRHSSSHKHKKRKRSDE